MFSKDRSIRLASLLSIFVTVVILAFLYNQSLDLGFVRAVTINDFIAYVTLMSAIFGGVFAYKILRTTLDQRDIPFMPFLSVISLHPMDASLEVRFRNNGLGPAIDVYWECLSSNLSFEKGRHRPDVIIQEAQRA